MEGVLMTGMANNASAVTYSQPVLPKHITQITDQINFAPTAPSHKLVFKSWERQPSTAFLARHKSRKIWKRFRKSMDALRGRRIAASPLSQIEESEFMKEISQSANASYVRAVKRQRLRLIRESHDGDNNNNEEENADARGRSFLETKWELETGKRKRKMVAVPQEEQLAADAHGAENEAESNPAAQSSLEGNPHFVVAVEAADNGASEDDDAGHGAVISEIVDLAVDARGSEAVAEVRQLIAKQQPTLVRSALRMNSLDGDDAALLSEFLSRAQAKRAANAAMMSNESKSVIIQKKGKNMDKKKDEEERQRQRQRQEQEVVTLSSPAIQSRRVLEELDVNSPTIQKPSASTPVKADKLPESPSAPEPDEDALNQMSSPTVACRRSTRTKNPKAQQTRSLRPAVPNQIPVRRANGTEFVFLQRTEAQELALTTRKNTRRNKGNSILPKYLLQALSKQERNHEATPPLHSDEDHQPQSRRSPRKHAEPKQVLWRDDNLVEFAPEKTSLAIESPSPGKKTSRREGVTKTNQDTTTISTYALPATPSKKVRRINMAAMSSSNTTATTDTNSATINKPLAAGTPIPKRKKITPKGPKGSSSSTTTATTTTSNNASTTELPPSHAHPSKSSSVSTDTRMTSTTKQSSGISGSQQTVQKASGIPRSKSLAKPSGPSSTAGATPMVKRVRAKRAAV